MIDRTTVVPPRPDIEVERTGELAFELAENAAIVVLEMGPMIHAGRDVVQRRSSLVVASSMGILYLTVSVSQKPT